MGFYPLYARSVRLLERRATSALLAGRSDAATMGVVLGDIAGALVAKAAYCDTTAPGRRGPVSGQRCRRDHDAIPRLVAA